MKTELYLGEYAELQEYAQSEEAAAVAADTRLAALTPGTLAYAAAELDCEFGWQAAGHALWELEQFEKEAARG